MGVFRTTFVNYTVEAAVEQNVEAAVEQNVEAEREAQFFIFISQLQQLNIDSITKYSPCFLRFP